MSPIRSLCGVLLAVALMVVVACGADGGRDGDASDRPREQASGDGGEGGDQTGEPKREGNGRGEDDEPAERENTIEVRVVGGRVEGVGDAVDVPLGEDVTIRVRSDEADEVHVHGYDEIDDVGPGEEAEIELTADIPGAFEVELEEAHLLLFELRVQ
jgi:hypothetical protein